MVFMTKNRARLGAAVALIGAGALALTACSSPAPEEPSSAATQGSGASGLDPYAPEQSTVNFMAWRTTSSAPLYLAEAEGIPEEYGIDFEVQYAENSPAAVSAVVGGTTDVGSASLWSVISAINEGIDLKIIGETFRHVTGSMFLETLPDSGIEELADLEGKKVGVVGLNAGHDLGIKNAFEEAGLDPSTIQFVNLGYGEMGQALQTGSIDAGTFTGPGLEQAREELGSVPVFDYVELIENFPATSYIVRGEWADANPNTVAAFQCSIAVRGAEIAREGGEEYEQNYIDAMAAGLEWDEAAVTGTTKIDHVTANDAAAQQIVPDLLFKNGLISEEMDIADYLIPLPETC